MGKQSLLSWLMNSKCWKHQNLHMKWVQVLLCILWPGAQVICFESLKSTKVMTTESRQGELKFQRVKIHQCLYGNKAYECGI